MAITVFGVWEPNFVGSGHQIERTGEPGTQRSFIYSEYLHELLWEAQSEYIHISMLMLESLWESPHENAEMDALRLNLKTLQNYYSIMCITFKV